MKKIVQNGYIIALSPEKGIQINTDEYNSIMKALKLKPPISETSAFKLQDVYLEWDSFPFAVSENDEITIEDKAEAYDIIMGDVICAGMTPQEKARQLRPLIEKPLISLTTLSKTLNGGK